MIACSSRLALLVVLATIATLVASALRTHESALGITFARACAAEREVTEESRPRLRADREDARAIVTFALEPRIEIKSSLSAREDDARVQDTVAPSPLAGARVLPFLAPSDARRRDAPSRARARLMVFLI